MRQTDNHITVFENCYFEWMYKKVMHSEAYRELLKILNHLPFRYSHPMDENAYIHGLEQRRKFCANEGYDTDILDKALGGDCTMLEMMVSLTQRICDVLLDDGDEKNKAPQMFMLMMDSLGISQFTDRTDWKPSTIIRIVNEFYEGRRFMFPTHGKDMTNVDIWHQCHWCLQKGDI